MYITVLLKLKKLGKERLTIFENGRNDAFHKTRLINVWRGRNDVENPFKKAHMSRCKPQRMDACSYLHEAA